MRTASPTRWNEGFFRPLERPALAWLAAKLPRWVTPDQLTGIGFAGAVLAAAGYAASGTRPDFLWLASVGLVINWFGDSLDGTVARLRRIERPRYGYYLDNSIDCIAQLLLAFGIGLSGYVRFDLCLFALVAYLMVSALSFIRANVSNVFQITYAAVGPTGAGRLRGAQRPSDYFPPRYRRLGASADLSQSVVAGMVVGNARHLPGDHDQADTPARDRGTGARTRTRAFGTGPVARVRGRMARHSADRCGTRCAGASASNFQSFGPLLIPAKLPLLSRQSHLVGEQRKGRMKVGIVPYLLRPAPHEISPLLPVERERIGIDAAGRGLKVDQHRFRRP